MGIYTDRKSLLIALSPLRQKNTIGFVPTMGALHMGHLSLVKQALRENDCVVVSIFVNPTQFDNPSDLKKYPRTLNEDIELLSKLDGNIIIFAPIAVDLYEGLIVSKNYSFGNIENEMEGRHRKGHFDGVGTVVNLLLRAVDPTKAYFGEKDFQQLQIIRKLVAIEKLPVKIVGCPIVRENNDLAMSSRNKRLSHEQFEEASLISKTLKEVKRNFDKMSILKLNEIVTERFLKNDLLKLEYFEMCHCRAIEYQKETAYYRILTGPLFLSQQLSSCSCS